MNTVLLKDIFYIEYGNQLDLNKLTIDEKEGINFISRSRENLGVQTKVKKILNKKLFKKGSITVALGGSVLSSFVQQNNFYTGQNIKVLTPKIELSDLEKKFYCYAIAHNGFRYSACGREANKTLDGLPVPSKEAIPKWVYEIKIPNIIKKPLSDKIYKLDVQNWQHFKLKDLFTITLGSPIHKNSIKSFYHKNKKGFIPYVTRTTVNNGIELYINKKEIDPKKYISGNVITIGAEGFKAFYQNSYFVTGNKVNILQSKILNPKIAFFLITVLNLEMEKKFNYGRAAVKFRLENLYIKLPSINNKPNWKLMENYINSLNYVDNKL
jgi:hypothetical protein